MFFSEDIVVLVLVIKIAFAIFRHICTMVSENLRFILILINPEALQFKISYITDYGHTMKTFFIEIQNFWAWTDKLGR